MHRWFVFIVIVGLPLALLADNFCSVDRPGKVFDALQAIDDSGEERLQVALNQLSEQENWSPSDRESYTLKLVDNPHTNAMEERRSDLVSEIFRVLARAPIDCDKLDALETEILNIERQQWDDAVRHVEERLESGSRVQGSRVKELKLFRGSLKLASVE